MRVCLSAQRRGDAAEIKPLRPSVCAFIVYASLAGLMLAACAAPTPVAPTTTSPAPTATVVPAEPSASTAPSTTSAPSATPALSATPLPVTEIDVSAFAFSPLWSPDKKLISVGWDAPSARYLAENLERLQDRPFDGVIYTFDSAPSTFPLAFTGQSWTEADLEFDALPRLRDSALTDNFIGLWAMSDDDVDWYDDARWETITANLRLISRAVTLSGSAGVMMDTEFYFYDDTFDPWKYDGQRYDGRSFEEVEDQVRLRGGQVMQALQSEAPDINILMFYFISHLYDEFGPDKQPGLWLTRAFAEGMLDKAAPGVILIDGNEPSYYYDDTRFFTTAYANQQESVAMFDPALADRYRQHVQTGLAVYPDGVFGWWNDFAGQRTPEYNARWFEHNLYQALQTTDEYVWMWCERCNWWAPDPVDGWASAGEPAMTYADLPDRLAPAGLTELIDQTRARFEQAEPMPGAMFNPFGLTLSYMEGPMVPFIAPSATWAEPVAGMTYAGDQPVLVALTVSGEQPRWVKLYLNSVEIGQLAAGELSTTLVNVPAGSYSLVAHVRLEDGISVTAPMRFEVR